MVLRKRFIKRRSGFNAFVIIEQAIRLVRRMQSIRIKPKPKKDTVEPEYFFKQSHKGDASSATCRNGFLTVRFFHGLAGGSEPVTIGTYYNRFSAVMFGHLHFYISW